MDPVFEGDLGVVAGELGLGAVFFDGLLGQGLDRVAGDDGSRGIRVISARFHDFLESTQHNILIIQRFLPDLSVLILIILLNLFEQAIQRLAHLALDLPIHLLEEGHIDHIINLVQLLNAVDEQVAVLDVFLLEQFPPFLDGVAVDQRVARFYLELMLKFIVIGIVVLHILEFGLVHVLTVDEQDLRGDLQEYENLIQVLLIL